MSHLLPVISDLSIANLQKLLSREIFIDAKTSKNLSQEMSSGAKELAHELLISYNNGIQVFLEDFSK